MSCIFCFMYKTKYVLYVCTCIIAFARTSMLYVCIYTHIRTYTDVCMCVYMQKTTTYFLWTMQLVEKYKNVMLVAWLYGYCNAGLSVVLSIALVQT